MTGHSLETSKQFAKDNLVALANEVLESKRTGLLDGPLFRALADQCMYWMNSSSGNRAVARDLINEAALEAVVAPIDMVLRCPNCGMQHVDTPEGEDGVLCAADVSQPWRNPPHRSHLCHGCGHIWRPADVPTNGVKAVKTCGKADSPTKENT